MDYNIYIHDSTGGSQNGSFTMPWGSLQKEQSPTTSWQSPEEQQNNFELKSLKTPKELISAGKSALLKAIPEVAIAFAMVSLGQKAVHLVDSAIQVALPYYETESGNFYLGIQYHNIKNAISAVKSPFQTINSMIFQERQIAIANQRRSMSRELLGDSVINTYTNRGI